MSTQPEKQKPDEEKKILDPSNWPSQQPGENTPITPEVTFDKYDEFEEPEQKTDKKGSSGYTGYTQKHVRNVQKNFFN